MLHESKGASWLRLVSACTLVAWTGEAWAHPPPESSEENLEESEIIEIQGAPVAGPPITTGREIGQETVSLTPARSADDLLRLVPGLFTSQHATEGKAQQFFLRGFDAIHGSDILISVSGVRLNEASNVHGHGYVDLGFLPPDVVLGMSARKGSFDLSQGNFATAGSVDFELGVEESQRGTRVGYEAGSTNRHRALALWAPPGQDPHNFVTLEAMHDQGFGDNRKSFRLSGVAQRRIEWSEHQSVELLGIGYGARFGQPGTIPIADVQQKVLGYYDTYDKRSDGESYRAMSGIRFRDDRDNQRLELALHASFRDLDLEQNNTGFLLFEAQGDRQRQTQRTTSVGARGHYERDLGAATLLGGTTLLVDRMRQAEDQILDSGQSFQRNRNLRGTMVESGLYGGSRWTAGDFTATAGARLDTFVFRGQDRLTDVSDGGTRAAVSPRVQASYRPIDALTLFAGYGRGVRSPELRAFTTPAPPMDAEPDEREMRFQPDITTTDAAELSARATLGERVTLGGGVFGAWIENEMVFDHQSNTTLARNATRRLGGELNGELRATDWLSFRSDLSMIDARFVDSGDAIPGVPQILTSFEARAGRATGWRAATTARFMAARPLAHGARGEAQYVMDALGGYRVGNIDFEMQVDNVTGSRWREGEYHYASWFDKSQARSEIPRLHYAAGRPFGIRAGLTIWF